MGKILELTGERFGDLVVKEFAGKDEEKNRLWLCECSCGNTIIVPTRYLRSWGKTHCGCKTTRRLVKNKKFGDLIAKHVIAASKWGDKLWLCECTCGNTIKVLSCDLTSGKKTNCGCKQKTEKEILKLDLKTKKEITSHNEKIFSGCTDFWICSDNESDLRSPSLENMQILVKKEMILKLTKKALEKITSIAKLDLFLAFLTGQRTF